MALVNEVQTNSPLAKGLLTGAIVNIDELSEQDFRRHCNWFAPEVKICGILENLQSSV